MQTLRADNLTSTYGEKTLFKDVSFIINENDRIGLIGTNGSGKTSLLNVIAGLTNAEQGAITKPSDYTIGYLQQQPNLDPQKTVTEAVFASDQAVFKLIRRYHQALDEFSQHPEDSQAIEAYTKLQAQMDQANAWEAESQIKTILTQLHLTDLNRKISELSGGS